MYLASILMVLKTMILSLLRVLGTLLLNLDNLVLWRQMMEVQGFCHICGFPVSELFEDSELICIEIKWLFRSLCLN